MIKVITTIEGFKNLESDWTVLYEKSMSKTPFQSFSYNYWAWTEFHDEEGCLYLLVSRSNVTKCINGIFPCFIDKKHTLRFINDKHTDFCSAIIDNEDFGHSSYEELSGHLQTDTNIRIIHFANLEYDNQLKSSFKPFFKNLYVFENNAYSKLSIVPHDKDKDFVDCLQGLNAKGRWKIRKELSSQDQLRFELVSVSSGKGFPQDVIDELRSIMICKGERTSEYFSERMLSFWRSMYQDGLLVVALLYKENSIYSAYLMFFDIFKNEYIEWIVLYREKKYNLVASIKLIEYLYNEGGAYLNCARALYIAKTPFQSVRVLGLLNWHYLKMIIKSVIRK